MSEQQSLSEATLTSAMASLSPTGKDRKPAQGDIVGQIEWQLLDVIQIAGSLSPQFRASASRRTR